MTVKSNFLTEDPTTWRSGIVVVHSIIKTGLLQIACHTVLSIMQSNLTCHVVTSMYVATCIQARGMGVMMITYYTIVCLDRHEKSDH